MMKKPTVGLVVLFTLTIGLAGLLASNKVNITTRIVNGVSCRIYTPVLAKTEVANLPLMIYYNGGGYVNFVIIVFSFLDTHHF